MTAGSAASKSPSPRARKNSTAGSSSNGVQPRRKAGTPLAASIAKPSVDSTAPVAPPLDPPPFSVADIRAAIPAHCFERSAALSLLHTFKDIAMAAAIFYAATFIGSHVPDVLKPVAWLAYWYAQGCVLTGLWVVAHECGHQAFSASAALNNTVGWILHSFLLVPYHSWRISHGNHHKYVPRYACAHAHVGASLCGSGGKCWAGGVCTARALMSVPGHD